ncbi:MAG: hypothetical protein RL748_1752 [Pseudomonadota bacterium]|jgi:hypothetical protein
MIALSELVTLHRGYTLRSTIQRGNEGAIALIQEKDMRNDGIQPGLQRINLTRLPKHHFLQPGDLVLRALGAGNRACVVTPDASGAICLAPLVYLRIHQPANLLPAFLAWFINTSRTQALLARQASKGRERMLTLEDLRKLPLPLPCVERQRSVLGISALDSQIAVLNQQLQDKQRLYAEESLLRFVGA